MSKTASGVCCVIKTCRASKRKVPNLRLFKFPKSNDIQLRKWLQACGIPDVSILANKKFLVCHRHFDPDQLGEVYLKKNAVPQRYLNTPPPPTATPTNNTKHSEVMNVKYSNSDTQENSSIDDCSSDNEKDKMSDTNKCLDSKYRKCGRRCIIKSCRATYRCNPNLRFFSFPNSKTDRFQKWVDICKLTAADLQLKNILICEKHFWKAELCGRRYTAEAEPKFFLSAPRYKVIGPSNPNFKPHHQEREIKIETVKNEKCIADKEKFFLNKCIIKTCEIIGNDLTNMMLFPKEALNLFDVWADIFKLDPAQVFNIDIDSIKESNSLYICKKHSLSQKELNNTFNERMFPSPEIKTENLDVDFDLKYTDLYNPLNNKCEKNSKIATHESDELKTIQQYELELARIRKAAEKEKIKHLSIISQLKEENFKLKDEISKFQ